MEVFPKSTKPCKDGFEHEWNVLDKTLMKSAWKRLGWLTRAAVQDISNDLLQEKLVITVQCKNCNALIFFVERNP